MTSADMTTQITVTVNGKKSGELIYFSLNVLKSRFLDFLDLEFNSVEEVVKGQETGIYKIAL